MLLFIEIAMLLGGLYAIVSGKVPGILIGGGNYQVNNSTARLFGVLWVLPLPVVFLGAILLSIFFGDEGVAYAGILELVTVLGVAVLSVVMMRVVGKPVEATNTIEAVIASKANGALMYAIFSMTGVATLSGAPLAWIYANQALKLIDEHQTGEQYRSKANIARVIGALTVLFWLAVCGCLLTFSVMGS